MFENGEDFELHNITSGAEAIKLLSNADDVIEKAKMRLNKLNATIENCQKMGNIGNKEWQKLAVDDLVQKYCYLSYQEKVKDFRKFAIEKKLRRPWDGIVSNFFL